MGSEPHSFCAPHGNHKKEKGQAETRPGPLGRIRPQ